MRDFQPPRMPGAWQNDISKKTFYMGLIQTLEEIVGHKITENDLEKKLKTKLSDMAKPETPEWKPLPVNTANAIIPDTNGCEYCKDGNVVWIAGGIKLVNSLAPNTNLVIGTMPVGMRPHRTIYEMHALGGAHFRLGVNVDGEIIIIHYNSGNISNAYNLPLKMEYIAE